MDRGGPFTEGDFPDDAGEGSDEDPLPLRGWVPPDDRLWLHPSEVAKLAGSHPAGSELAGSHDAELVDAELADAELAGLGARAGESSAGGRARGKRPEQARRSRLTTLSVAMVTAAVVLLVLVVERGPGAPTTSLPVSTTSLATALVPSAALSSVTARLSRSLVGLVVRRSSGTATATGTAMAPGDLVVTAASAVDKATSITAVSPSGQRLHARVLGSDPTSGVAVVKVNGKLDPARFGNDVIAGQLAMTACVCSRATDVLAGHLAATMALARVDAVGVRPASQPKLLDAIETGRVRSDGVGSVLTDSNGRVDGVLAGRITGRGNGIDMFVPGWLAAGVAQQLANQHRVIHGWLGVTAVSVPGTCGAQVVSVVPGTPAQHTLVPGDVVVAVDGRPVCDWAELQASLYVVAPDQPVDLQVVEPSGATTVAVALSGSPN